MVPESKITGVLIRKGKTHGDRKICGSRPHDHRGRGWNDAAASQRMLRTTEASRS